MRIAWCHRQAGRGEIKEGTMLTLRVLEERGSKVYGREWQGS